MQEILKKVSTFEAALRVPFFSTHAARVRCADYNSFRFFHICSRPFVTPRIASYLEEITTIVPYRLIIPEPIRSVARVTAWCRPRGHVQRHNSRLGGNGKAGAGNKRCRDANIIWYVTEVVSRPFGNGSQARGLFINPLIHFERHFERQGGIGSIFV